MTVHELFGLLVYELCIKLYCGVYEVRNDYEIWVYEVEPILGDWP